MGFPKSLVSELLTSLKAIILIKSPSKADDKIEKLIMTWYAKIFGTVQTLYNKRICPAFSTSLGHFRVYGDALLSSRSRKRLIVSHPSKDVREMLTWFAETGILQTFFFNQVTSVCCLSNHHVFSLLSVEQPVFGNGGASGTFSAHNQEVCSSCGQRRKVSKGQISCLADL